MYVDLVCVCVLGVVCVGWICGCCGVLRMLVGFVDCLGGLCSIVCSMLIACVNWGVLSTGRMLQCDVLSGGWMWRSICTRVLFIVLMVDMGCGVWVLSASVAGLCSGLVQQVITSEHSYTECLSPPITGQEARCLLVVVGAGAPSTDLQHLMAGEGVFTFPAHIPLSGLSSAGRLPRDGLQGLLRQVPAVESSGWQEDSSGLSLP